MELPMSKGKKTLQFILTPCVLLTLTTVTLGIRAPTRPLKDRVSAAETVFLGKVVNKVVTGEWARAELLVEEPLRNAEKGKKTEVIWRVKLGRFQIYDVAAGTRGIAILKDKHQGRYWLRSDKFEKPNKLAEVKGFIGAASANQPKKASPAGVAAPGGMRLLPGYTHKPLRGIDSIVGQIVKDDGWKISYEIGRVSKPGQPMTGGGFRDRPKLTPKAKVLWYREQTVSCQPVHMALCKDNTLLVSFPGKGMNFRATIRSLEQLADAMLMILTYSQSATAAATKHTSKPSTDAGKLTEAPATIIIDGKKLTLQVEGINNRMPTIGPRTNTGIYFIIRLKTTDRSAIPKGVTFDTVFGVQGKKKWETKKFDGPRGRVSSMVEIVARNAPAWTVSAKIDVIVKLRDSAKTEHLIRAANVGAMEVH
jgi:hypothetical protein